MREVDVVMRACVKVCDMCVGLQTGVTAALHGASQVVAPLPLFTSSYMYNMAVTDSGNSLIRRFG